MTAGAVAAPLIVPLVSLHSHRGKTNICTDTEVCIQSEAPGSQIFYTLDGSRPTAAARAGSRKYTEPVRLPAGRVTVRAVASSSDGRESVTVTKVFFVDPADATRKRKDESLSGGGPGAAGDSAGSPLNPPETRQKAASSPAPGPRLPGGPSPPRRSESDVVLVPPGGAPTSRVLRATDFLRCPRCLAPLPSDPFHSFCPRCGAEAPRPERRPPPPEGGQMVLCVFCHSLTPINTSTCLICEASVEPQLQPQSSLRLQGHVTCRGCDRVNPAHISSCVSCERPLLAAPEAPGATSPPPCSRCNRRHRGDARFCDWCGQKLRRAISHVTCRRCGANGHPWAIYCSTCGASLDAPPPSNHVSAAGDERHKHQTSTSHEGPRTMTTSPGDGLAPPTSERHTQTVGLFYPSAAALQKQELQLRGKEAIKDRPLPPLTPVSPGRGYWRKQLDHICAHLRSFTQNNVAFRGLLGEPRLGRMVSAVIREDGREVSLTASFASAGQEVKQALPEGGAAPGVRSKGLSSVMERNASGSHGSDLPPAAPKTPKAKPTAGPPTLDVRLLAELGPGRGSPAVVRRLLDQGADPCCHGDDGRNALALATANDHHQVLPVLVQSGADVDRPSGPTKNTALHDAAARGDGGRRCAEVLLSLQATPTRRNAGGDTPYDLALSSGCEAMVTLLAAHMGRHMLRQATRLSS